MDDPLGLKVQQLRAMGESLLQGGKTAEAIAALRRAIDLSPLDSESHYQLGDLLRSAGQVDLAIAAYHAAISLRPDFGEAYSNLGNALRSQHRLEESLQAHHQARRLRPNSAGICNNLGLALKEAGRWEEALVAFDRAIGLDAQSIEARNNRGNALALLQRFDEAIAAYSQVLKLKPNLALALSNLGNALKDAGRLDEGIAAHQRAISLQPGYAEAHCNLGVALTSAGRLDEAIAAFRRSIALGPGSAALHANLLYTLYFHEAYDAATILAEHRAWAGRFADPLSENAPRHDDDPATHRKLKVGYVSGDFRRHPVGRFLAPLLDHHDHSKFEIFCYSAVRQPDDLTERLRRRTDHWRDIAGWSDVRAAEQIRRDGIDVLIDLALHMDGNRLLIFAHKPAPVQATWLGYAGTSGMKAMDYRLSDPYLDPPGESDATYSEQTVRLPHSYWCFEPPADAPTVVPAPAAQAGYVTFGCLNNFAKVGSRTMDLWAAVLKAIPTSHLLLHSPAGRHRDGVRELFARAGVTPDRIDFVARLPTAQYLGHYQRIDIALDPTPCAGGTTTLDALWMGVPVVTLAGQTAVGRAGVSLMSNVGLPEFIARTAEEYVAIAARWANDLPALCELRQSLRQPIKDSPLSDAPRFARDMEAAYLRMWQEIRHEGNQALSLQRTNDKGQVTKDK